MWVSVNGEWFNFALAMRIRMEEGKLFIEFPPQPGEHLVITVEREDDQRRILAFLVGGAKLP